MKCPRTQTECSNLECGKTSGICAMNNQPSPVNVGVSKEDCLDRNGFDFEAFKYENEYSAKNILNAMEEYAQQFLPSSPQIEDKQGDRYEGIEWIEGVPKPSTPSESKQEQGEYDGGWKFEPEWLRELTSKINEMENGDGVQMEEVETVLLAINYQSTPYPSVSDAVDTASILQRFAEHLGEKELNTTDKYAVKWTVKELSGTTPAGANTIVNWNDVE